jgi:hypothetical protein
MTSQSTRVMPFVLKRSMSRSRGASLALLASMLGLFLFARSIHPERAAPSDQRYSEAVSELQQRRVMPIGQFLPTALDSAASWTLGPGFLHPEEDGTWMAQLSAGIQFSVMVGGTPSSAEIDLEPLVATLDRDRRVTISSTVDEVSTVLRGGRTKLLIALDDEREQNITIACDAVSSPMGLQLGPDRRAFCAKIHGYTIFGDEG